MSKIQDTTNNTATDSETVMPRRRERPYIPLHDVRLGTLKNVEGAVDNLPVELPRVVIVGAGFGGLRTARALRNAPVQVTVIDRQNHHLFQPLLYWVATAGLSRADISSPIRSILRRQKNIDVLMAEVTGVDVDG